MQTHLAARETFEVDGSGGPAFPRPFSLDNDNRKAWSQDGMTLRDYFAAKAMAALIPMQFHHDAGELSAAAFRIADAMLAERVKAVP